MAKIPPFIYSKYNDQHFIVDTRFGITCHLYMFATPEEAKACRLRLHAQTMEGKTVVFADFAYHSSYFVLNAVRFVEKPSPESRLTINKAQKQVDRMADWFLFSILRERNLQ